MCEMNLMLICLNVFERLCDDGQNKGRDEVLF